MSLNQFLAVGRSFVGIRGEKSPFEMKKDCLLPRFDPAPRFAAKLSVVSPPEKAPVQTDWLEQKEKHTPAPLVTPLTHKPADPEASRPGRRTWLSLLTFGLLGGRKNKGTKLVQAELTLEKVRVIRNDLHDSDLELVRKGERPRARKATAAARSLPLDDQEQTSSRLAARLLEIERR